VSEAWLGVASVLVLFVVAPVLLLMARDRFQKARWLRQNPPERVAEERQRFERRLAAPDWPFYEEHLQRTVPVALMSWFANPATVLKRYVFEDHLIDFAPIDREQLRDGWVVADVVAFAESDGDPIYLKPGTDADDSVFITFHDGGDTELLAPSVEQFLARLEEAP
jgi:hypothetical protein